MTAKQRRLNRETAERLLNENRKVMPEETARALPFPPKAFAGQNRFLGSRYAVHCYAQFLLQRQWLGDGGNGWSDRREHEF